MAVKEDAQTLQTSCQQDEVTGIPPDQQRLNEQITALEALQRYVAQRLRLAKAHSAVAIAENTLKSAQAELVNALAASDELQADVAKLSMNPSAPTDCKVVQKKDEAQVVASGPKLGPQHPGSSPRQGVASNGVDAKPKKNAKTMKKRMKQQSLQSAQSRQEPEPENLIGHVQKLVASFEALGNELEPDYVPEPATEPNEHEDEVLEPASAPNEDNEKGPEPDNALEPDSDDVALEPDNALELATEPHEEAEETHGPDTVLVPARESHEDDEKELGPDNALEPPFEPNADDEKELKPGSDDDDSIAKVAAIFTNSCLPKEKQQYWVQQLYAACACFEDPTSLQAFVEDMKLQALQIAADAARRGAASLPAQDAPT